MHVFNKIMVFTIYGGLALGGSGCTLTPSAGPSAHRILNAATPKNDIKIIELNEGVNQAIKQVSPTISFFEKFGNAEPKVVVTSGDVLQINVWEAPPAVLFGHLGDLGSGGGKLTELPEQMVRSDGSINIPFVGKMNVKGKTVSIIEDDIRGRIKYMANHPQVMVKVLQNNTANVTVVKDGKTISLPLTAKGERVLDVLAAIGGEKGASMSSLRITRHNESLSMPLSSVIENSRNNIHLLPGDIVESTFQPQTFIVFGATGRNEEMKFESQGISLSQALARMGGLNDNRANPRGVFVFRYEKPEVIDAIESKADHSYQVASTPVIYKVDMSEPTSFFMTQNFMMRDKDILYVSNAPIIGVQKFLSMVLSLTNSAQRIYNIAQ